jgi:hypothetical protein
MVQPLLLVSLSFLFVTIFSQVLYASIFGCVFGVSILYVLFKYYRNLSNVTDVSNAEKEKTGISAVVPAIHIVVQEPRLNDEFIRLDIEDDRESSSSSLVSDDSAIVISRRSDDRSDTSVPELAIPSVQNDIDLSFLYNISISASNDSPRAEPMSVSSSDNSSDIREILNQSECSISSSSLVSSKGSFESSSIADSSISISSSV